MNCNPNAIIAAAVRFMGMHRDQLGQVRMALICKWLNSLTPIVPTEVTWAPDTAPLSHGPNHVPGRLILNNDGIQRTFDDLLGFRAYDPTQITTLDMRWSGITSIAGLQNLTSLVSLFLPYNDLTSIDLSGMHWLQRVNLNHFQPFFPASVFLQSINLKGCSGLLFLNLNQNSVSAIDLSDCSSLANLFINTNTLLDLDVSGKAGLALLECEQNLLGNINITGDISLSTFWFGQNPNPVVIGP